MLAQYYIVEYTYGYGKVLTQADYKVILVLEKQYKSKALKVHWNPATEVDCDLIILNTKFRFRRT